MNKNVLVFSVCLLLIKVVFGQQGNSCASPINLNPNIPVNGNGKHKVTVDNSVSSQFYTYTATQEGVIEMSSAYSTSPGDPNFDTWLKVYDNNCNLIFDKDDIQGLLGGVEYTTEVSIGDTYVFEWSNQEWGGIFDVEFIYQEKITEGINCNDPIDIILGAGTNEAKYWFGAQYYKYTAPAYGVFEVSTCNDVQGYYRQITIQNACNGSSLGDFDDSCDVEDSGYGLVKYNISKGETVIVKMKGYNDHMHHDYNFSASFTEKVKVDIPGVEFEKRLISLGIDTGSQDGYISVADAEAVTGTLDLSYVDAGGGSSSGSGGSPSGLVNLTGIDAFINITGLKVSKNSPFVNDAIEVIDLSKNLKLTSVEFNTTTAISSFDFSANTKLESLKIISDYTAISTLNLTGLSSLTELRLQNITLPSLDLSAHPNLEILDIYISSNLSALNFSGLTSLNNLRLERMGSAFTAIDLTAPSASLRYLNIINNPNLATVTLSNFSFLSNASIKDNPLLTEILDFSTAGSLVNLDISNNDLSSVNLKNGANNAIVNLDIRNNTNLTCVKVDNPSDSYGKNSWLKDAQAYYVKENCDRVAISDTEFEKRLISKGIDTTGQEDGYILKDDAEAVTGILDMTENGRTHQTLTSYSGIESFVNITGFIADSDNDVITSLNLSSNTKLTAIDIKGITNFSDLDFTANTSLEILKVGSSRAVITGLNISGLTGLRELDILNTSLDTLDVSSFTNLSRFILSEANELTNIDLSSNLLTDVVIVNYCAKLKTIDVATGSNVIENVNVTNNANLVCVKVDDTSFADDNWFKDAHTIFSDTNCEFINVGEEFEKRLISTGIDKSTIQDGFILKTDAETVTGTLDLSTQISEPLTSYAGIENFVNITGFIASNVTDIIGSLDLSNNLLLKTIDIQGVTNFADFDFTAHTNLETLKINGTRTSINTLNINGLNELKVVEIYNSSIAALNLEPLTKLTTLKLNTLSNLEAVDISNTAVLEQLIINNCNSLITLDVANGANNLISSFDITNNAVLECVKVDDITTANTWTNKDDQTYYSKNGCEFVSIPDVEFEKRLIALGIDSRGLEDGFIFKGDAEAVTGELNIAAYVDGPIANLKGLEAFSNITGFRIGDSSTTDTYTTLDLSNSLLLEEVVLNHTSATSLDFSANTNLQILKIEDSEKYLESLNIIGLTNLEQLSLSKSVFTTLDLSTNTALKILAIEFSKGLQYLDLSKNVHLENVNIKDNEALLSVNLNNGNNSLISRFYIVGNDSLVCVQVDNESNANADWTDKDDHTFYNENSCEFVSIPDVEFEKRLINLGIAKSSFVDGIILKHEAESVTGDLNISTIIDEYIKDLTGIEAFINIKRFLSVNEDEYSDLDLSNSTLLEEVLLYYTNVTDLDFTANVNLRKLVCSDRYINLNSFNINGLDKLEEIELIKLSASSLDLTTNTALKKIKLDYINNLTELDLSNNINLLDLDLGGATLLSSLDLTKNLSLKDLRLSSSNSLLNLNLSNNTLIESVNISDLDNLKSLNVANGANNILSNFNLSINNSLVCVQVDNVAEANTNWIYKEAHNIYTNQACDFVSIPDAEFEKRLINLGIANSTVVDGVILKSEAEAVTSLNISTEAEVNGSIADFTGLESFVNITTFKAINANDRITSLDVSKNTLLEELNIQNMMDFSDYDLSSNTSLKKIQIKNGYQSIAELNISASAPLKSLEIINTSVASLDISPYTAISYLRIENAPNLVELDVNSNIIMQELFVVNCDALTSLNTSESLQLNTIDVKDSENIQRLDLSNNTLLSRVSVTGNLNLKSMKANNLGHIKTDFFNIIDNPSLLCVQVDNVNFANTNWTNKDEHTIYSDEACESVTLQIKVYLEGAIDLDNDRVIMRDDLRSRGFLPGISPYEQDVILLNIDVFDAGGSFGTGAPDDDIVDWVFIELLDKNDDTKVLSNKSALIQRDGNIVELDGVSNLTFDIPEDDYFIAIRHRNHLIIRSKDAVSLSMSLSTHDFTNNLNFIAGEDNAMIHLGDGNYAIPTGDFDGNGQIQVEDFNQVILNLGKSGYNNSDINMNGEIQNLDINDFIIKNMGKGKQF